MQQYFLDEEVKEEAIFNKEQAHHMINVLRMKNDDVVKVVDLLGNAYLVKIKITNSTLIGQVIEKLDHYDEKVNITLIAALLKGDKWDYMIQKVCELGVSTIIPLTCKRCVVKVNDKTSKKIERFNKIALEACEQCKRESIVKVMDVINISDLKDYRSELNLIAYEDADFNGLNLKGVLKSQPKSITIIIGPEGGFEKEEVKQITDLGYTCISLGKRILRAETASISSISNIMFYYE